MTVKNRNRFIKILFIFSAIFLFATEFVFLHKFLQNKIDFSIFQQFEKNGIFLFRYNPYVVLGSCFLQIFYVCTVTYVIYRSFEKTPAIEAVYMLLYLFAILGNSFRILNGLFNLIEIKSYLLIAIGDIILFSKLLYPISLLCAVVMPVSEQKQDTDRNVFTIIMLCLFFATIIPLNTLKVMPDFSVDYSMKILIRCINIICTVFGTIVLFIVNKKHHYNQKTTLGFIFTIVGIAITINTVNLLEIIISFILLSLGTYFYFFELHKQFLMND